MKKILAAIAVLLLILTGVFFWKGGHHALALSHTLEEYWDTDEADQTLTLQFQDAGFQTDSDGIKPQVWQNTLLADAFWTEYEDDRVLGLTVGGLSAYLRDDVLYTDSGMAYALPDYSQYLQELKTGLLLYGRVTKEGGTYRISMEREALTLSISVTAAPEVQAISVTALLPDKTFHADLTPKSVQPHPLPQTVLDAMVRGEMSEPIPILEPLETAVTAASALFPLSGDLTLGMDCGILELSETVEVQMDARNAEIERGGTIVNVRLPEQLTSFPPQALGLALLHSGEYDKTDSGAAFTVRLSPETTGELIAQLVPQAAELGIEYTESEAVVSIKNGKITAVTMTAGGSVPFLVTAIPLSFCAELNID